MDERYRWAARIVAAAILGVFAWWVTQSGRFAFESIEGQAFATTYRIKFAAGPDTDALQKAVDQELAQIDAMASTWRDDSELMRFNHAADPGQFELSQQLSGLIERAREIQAQTDGAFSVRPGGTTIDLSAIAKGYAVDRVVELMQSEFGITDGLVDIGGEVRAFGSGPGGDGWRVGLYPSNEVVLVETPVLQLRDTSIATSGVYFKGDHITDPATGEPVDNALHSASVIHTSNTTADALATAMFVMGPDDGLAWAKQNAVHVIFLLKDGTRIDHEPE